MNEEQIYSKYRVEIDLVNEFSMLPNQICQRLVIDPDDGQQVMVAGLSERLRTSATGALLLGRVGLAAEVKVLARVCVEVIFKMQAICSDPKFMKAYAQEHLFFRRKSLIAITTDLRSSFSVAELAKAEEGLKSVKLEIADLGAKEMFVSQWAQAANLSEMYRSLYALLSGFVHASANSLEDWLPVDAEDNLVEVVSGPTDFDLPTSLLAIATCLQFGIHDINVFFGLEIENDTAFLSLTQRREAAYGFKSNV